ncbi:MAG: PilT/PilU family type 4a pilus ATPase [Alphaproteobacteria bacterium]
MDSNFINEIFNKMLELDTSDVYITSGKPPMHRKMDSFIEHEKAILNGENVLFLARNLLNNIQYEEFLEKLEFNIAIDWQNKSRFRINFFYQQLLPGMVIRRVRNEIPTIESLNLPYIYSKIILKKKGLILISSPSGTGKSTSVAAMLNYRNDNGYGHIITIEDPIEYVHSHKNCIFTQREIGIDTLSYDEALKNALRQRADVIFIGEIRDKKTMDYAINFAETGHLCIATIHSNNTSQAIFRILNFYSEETHKHILYNLSVNLEAILSQKLIKNNNGDKSLATEILLNLGVIKKLILEGKINEIRDILDKQVDQGMQSFDYCLYELHKSGKVSEEEALFHADNPGNLKLKILQNNANIILPLNNDPNKIF